MFFNKILSSFDLFKKPLILQVSKNEKISTKFGILLSLVIYSYLAYFFSQRDFFLKLNPKIVIENTQLSSPPSIIYKDQAFSFAVKDKIGNFVNDPTYFTVSIQSVAMSLNEKGVDLNIEPKSYHVCNENDSKNPEEFKTIANSFCLDNSTFNLFGDLGDPASSIFQIHIFLCINSTQNNNSCKPLDEIHSYFNMKSLNINYKNAFFQLKSYENPTIENFYTSVYKLEAKLNRLITINLQKAEIITEETVITSSQTVIEKTLVEKENTEIGLSISDKDPIASVLFFSSKNKVTAHRSYQSLTETFAELGGLFSVFLILGKIITNIDCKIYLTTLLMNFLYSFQQSDSHADANNKNKNINNLKIDTSLKNIDKLTPETKLYELGGLQETSRGLIDKNKLKSLVINENNDQKDTIYQSEKLKEKVLEEDNVHMSFDSIENKGTISPQFTVIKLDDNLQSDNVNIISSIKQSQIKENSLNNSQSQTKIQKILRKLTLSKIPKNAKTESLEEFVRLSEKNDRISFNIFDYFKLLIKKIGGLKLNLNEKLFNRAHEIFENEIDIIKILKRVQDIEKLKYLLLNENQIILFDLLEKPMIIAEENEKELNHSFSSVFFDNKRRKSVLDGKLKKAFDYYQELEEKKNRGSIDEKLFKLVDKRFKTYKKYFKNN